MKAKNPNGEEHEELLSDPDSSPYPEMPRNPKELEALLKRSHDTAANLKDEKSLRDKNTEISKRIAPGVIIAGAKLTMDLLQKLLDVIEKVGRKIAIGIDNESTFQWQQGRLYFRSGTGEEILPNSVENGKAVLYAARKSKGPVLTGVVGVLTYFIPDKYLTLAVMWSVPFDYNLHPSNYWNVGLYNGKKRPNHDMYKDLYYHAHPFKAGAWETKYLGGGLKCEGFMTPPGNAKLKVKVVRM